MPVVFVIRHAEDTPSGPHDLTAEGQKHAELYIMLFNNYIWGDTHSLGKDKTQVCVCPIGKFMNLKFYHQIFYAKDCKSGASFTPSTSSECLIPQQRSY